MNFCKGDCDIWGYKDKQLDKNKVLMPFAFLAGP